MRPNSIRSPLIWDLFEVTHEGASQFKESKTSLLTHIHDIFKMEDNETINAIYNRFNYFVVGLKGLGKTIGKAEVNNKLLMSPQGMTTQGDDY